MHKSTLPVSIDESGCFYAQKNSGRATFLSHGGEILSVNNIPGGCWPFLYVESDSGTYLYFTYFLSSVLHKWKLKEDGSRDFGLGIDPIEIDVLFSSLAFDGCAQDNLHHIFDKVAKKSVSVARQGSFDIFIKAERLVSSWILKYRMNSIPDLQIIKDDVKNANTDISTLTRLSNVPKDYQSNLTFISDVEYRKDVTAHDLLALLDFGFLQKIHTDLILDLNRDKESCFFEFELGEFTSQLPEVIEVRKRLNRHSHFCVQGWIIEIGLSRHFFVNRESRDSWLKRIKMSLNTLKRDIAAFFSDQIEFGRLRLSLGDGGNLVPKTVTFDGESGKDEIVMPDLYILAERPLRRFFTRSNFHEFEKIFYKKEPKLFWRGSTTGALGDRDLEGFQNNYRVKACLLSRQTMGSRADMKIVNVTGVKPAVKSDAETLLIESGIKTDPVPETEFAKYQIYIDLPGNVAAWGTYRKYLFGCVVLRPPTDRVLLYYQLLEPWDHFIPLNADLSNLKSSVEWVVENQQEAAKIAFAGRNRLLDYISNFDSEIQTAFIAGFEVSEP